MSTRSRIGIERPDGSILSIYCHHDGYLEGPYGVGWKLHTHYRELPIVEKLMKLGNHSVLKEVPPAGRIYGEAAQTCADRAAWVNLYEEFNYLFTADGWVVIQSYGEDHEKTFRPLIVALVTDRLEA